MLVCTLEDSVALLNTFMKAGTRVGSRNLMMIEGFGREPSPLNIPNSGKSPRRKKKFWEKQNSKVRDKTKDTRYVYVKTKGHSSIGDGRAKRGYKKFQDEEEDLYVLKPPSPTDMCGCNSGKSYRQCCGSLHQTFVAGTDAGATPEQVLRARYTAHKYGLSSFIIDSSHPKNPDYIYHMVEAKATKNSGTKRWQRDILAMSNTYQFKGLEIVDVSTEGDVSNVIFRTLLQENSEEGNYIPIEENAVFLRAGGRWMYQDGETDEPEEAVAREMVEEWPAQGQRDDDTDDLSRPAPIKARLRNPSPKEGLSSPIQRPDRVAASAGLSKETWASPQAAGRHSR